ncbi:MAG: O-antigen ligase [Rhodothermia bacterium]|nr:MAG: O-antigen ligase [Rhodothermia bacterium]
MEGTRAIAQLEPLGSARHGGLFVFLLLILAWAPIPIGSNREWSMALLGAAALTLVAGCWLSYIWRPFVMPDAVQSGRISLFFLLLWAVYPLLQLLPLPIAFVEIVGGEVHGLYGELPAKVLSEYAYLSLDRGATFSGFIWQSSLVALLVSVLLLTTSRSRLRILMIVMLLVGSAEALYGLVLYLGGDELGLWAPGQALGTVSGTYVNQNHFAGLMEVTIPVGLGLLVGSRPENGGLSGARKVTQLLLTFLTGQGGLILFSVLIMFAALILTTSRGAIGALAVGMVFAISIAVWTKGVHARELRLGVIAIALVLIAIFWMGAGQFSEKLQSGGLSSNRGDQRELTYRMVQDSPIVGTGVGTYRWIFPNYKDERFGGYFYEHAHNDFLEVLAEQGFVGFSLLAAGIVLIFFRVVRAFARRGDPLMRGALFATIAGCVSLLVHGLVDFNLQIPANAGFFVVLLGVGLVASEPRHHSASR